MVYARLNVIRQVRNIESDERLVLVGAMISVANSPASASTASTRPRQVTEQALIERGRKPS
jgi:hypothetical protein